MKEVIFPELRAPLMGPPVIRKNGIIIDEGGEMSVFVRGGRLMGLMNYWGGYEGYPGACAVIFDYFTGEAFPPFGRPGCYFYQAYCQAYCQADCRADCRGERVYVYAAEDNRVIQFVSDDLVHWEESVALEFPETFKCHNTAVCRGDDGYVMVIECGEAMHDQDPVQAQLENPYIGVRFTEFFATSPDLVHWTLMPFDKAYTKERYNACPALKFCDGYYYMICLESLPCARWAPYIYRTADFDTWEIGYYNPLFIPSREDLYPKEGVTLSEEARAVNFRHLNVNNSDIDLCEYEGKTYIVYASGNQGVTWGGLYCEAVYDGPLNDFLRANFS